MFLTGSVQRNLFEAKPGLNGNLFRRKNFPAPRLSNGN
jgi:hypothetical protein